MNQNVHQPAMLYRVAANLKLCRQIVTESNQLHVARLHEQILDQVQDDQLELTQNYEYMVCPQCGGDHDPCGNDDFDLLWLE